MTKILIVEDEEAISDLIKMSLTKAGYHCEQAMDGLEAADCIEGKSGMDAELCRADSGKSAGRTDARP